tara:strand:+ start:98 stop:277 length:180 start_codon:yes stop_codon:yes gene_type:complete
VVEVDLVEDLLLNLVKMEDLVEELVEDRILQVVQEIHHPLVLLKDNQVEEALQVVHHLQ